MNATEQQPESPNVEAPSPTPLKKNRVLMILSILMFFIILGLAVWMIMGKQKTTETTPDNQNQSTSNQTPENNTGSDTVKLTEEKSDTEIVDVQYFNTFEGFVKKYDSLSESTLTAIKNNFGYEEQADIDGKHNMNIAALPDQNNTDILYLDNPNKGFYSLDLTTNTLKLLRNFNSDQYTVRLAGAQGNKLLFQVMDSMDSPGPCYNNWTFAYENPNPTAGYPKDSRTFQSWDLDNPNGGLTHFPVPKEKYEIEKKIEEQCSVEFDAARKQEEAESGANR